MQPPFNIVVKIIEDSREVYLNTEHAIKIEITKSDVPGLSEVLIVMSNGSQYKLVGFRAEDFIDRVEGK